MLTILNLINYFTGDNVSIYILIIATIIIYYYIISNYLQNIYDNKIFLTIFVMLMLIDITSIILIFYYRDDGTSNDVCISKSEKKNKKNREERNKKKSINLVNTDTNEAKISDKEESKKNYNSIKIFNESPDETLSTYKN